MNSLEDRSSGRKKIQKKDTNIERIKCEKVSKQLLQLKASTCSLDQIVKKKNRMAE